MIRAGGAKTIAQLVRAAAARLAENETPTPGLDARILAEEAFGLDAAGLIVRGGDAPLADAMARYEQWIERRLAGEPVHRIIGRRAFYAHDFVLSQETLEPRPETEALVALAARALAERAERRSTEGRPAEPPLLVDAGTGTGAIAVSLLALFSQALCIGVDLAPGALDTARRNAQDAGVASRFFPVASDYLGALAGPFDLIVSNPPYIRSGDIAALSREVRNFDPLLALDGGADGLDAYRRLAPQCAASLHADGDVLVEIGAGQADDVAFLFAEAGFVLTAVQNDLAAIARALRFRRA